MTALAAALIGELTDDDLAALAERLAPFMPAPEVEPTGPPAVEWPEWMATREAARYLGISPTVLQRLARRGKIVARQGGEGCKYYFARADLDAYRSR